MAPPQNSVVVDVSSRLSFVGGRNASWADPLAGLVDIATSVAIASSLHGRRGPLVAPEKVRALSDDVLQKATRFCQTLC